MIKHIKGDIFESDAKIILHQVNCQGVMGSGVAKQVRERYPIVYDWYKYWCDDEHTNPKNINPSPLLGKIQSVYVDGNKDGRIIINLYAQDKYGYDGRRYTQYEALRRCFQEVNKQFKGNEIAIPYKIACCRGGGNWDLVYKMIECELADCDVTLYEYNGG